ncbi:palmitoyl-protein thioesterase 1 isoform X1 [Anopheles nili]|uniref:palmitoyl-protein thioesterase 1 isoform X1 n=1 Tax=Anopheles nili TaxID=185578 RepID=UPI00237A874C|nr:palmitoyl-protein thioesterase 1 isoform X1 [Anopheles nili]
MGISKVDLFAFAAALFCSLASEVHSEKLPIVLWHGMGDTCCFPFSLGGVKKFLESEIGVYVKSIEIGNSITEDFKSGYLVHPNQQVEMVCADLNNDTKLSNGFNGIGFSQGGQFLRAVVQRCSSLRMSNLITLGGQHQGVFGLPNCPSLSSRTCERFRQLLNYAAYTELMQNFLVQATYWHDPLDEAKYKNSSTFLGDINNERSVNQTYVDNLKKLNNFVMVRFNKDSIVQPLDSQWFGYYKPGQDKETQGLRDSEIYIQDRLGLQEMDKQNKIAFLECEGNHLQFTKEWFRRALFPYLK